MPRRTPRPRPRLPSSAGGAYGSRPTAPNAERLSTTMPPLFLADIDE